MCYACIQLWENRQGESFAKCTIIAQLGKSMEVLGLAVWVFHRIARSDVKFLQEYSTRHIKIMITYTFYYGITMISKHLDDF